MPHGKERRHLWQLFPSDLRQGDAGAVVRRLRTKDWYAITDSPCEPIVRISGHSVPDGGIPPCDLYATPVEGGEEVIAFDHESEGPWILEEDARTRIDWIAPPRRDGPSLAPAQRVGQPEARRLRSKVLSRLRERTYIPRYSLALTGPAADHLWNYLPKHWDTTLGDDSLAAELLSRAEEVLVWSDSSGLPMWSLPGSAVEWRRWAPADVYIVDSPRMQWLIAIPGSFLLSPDESNARPSFVALR